MRRRKIRWTACIILALLAPGQPARAQAPEKMLTIAADEWCPINCIADSKEPGIGVELARRVFEPLGYEVRYVVMPWSRALEEVRAGRVDAVVGANQSDDPTLLFPRHAIYHITDGFYVRADSPVRFKDMNSLKDLRIGIIKGYGFGPAVSAFLASARKTPGMVQETGGDDAREQNIRKLLADRIDVIIESRAVMGHTLARLGKEEAIKWIGEMPQGDVYLAFSPTLSASKTRVRQYDEGIDRLRAEGALPALYAPYHLQP